MQTRAWFRTALFCALTTVVAPQIHAQNPADLVPESSVPAEVSKALRDRIKQFFDFHTGSVNRRAIDMVAEDTKDYYFASQKVVFSEVRIDKTEFSKDLTKATAWTHGTRKVDVQGQSLTVDSPIVTTWRLEDGKWVWYVDQKDTAHTPMGPSDPLATAAAETRNALNQLRVNPDGTLELPKDFATPEALMAQKNTILQQAGLDKSETTLTYGVASKDQFTFKNGFNGDIMIELLGAPEVPGLKVTLDKRMLGAHENAVVSVQYDPPADAATLDWTTRTYSVDVMLQPFNQSYTMKLKVQAPPAK